MNNDTVKSMIPKSWTVPAIFRNRLGEQVGRQRLMCEDGEFLLVLHRVPRAEDRGCREGALFWINAIAEWKSTPQSGGRSSLLEHVDSYQQRLKDLDEELESTATAEEIHAVIDEVTPILRASRNMLAVVQQLRQELKDDQKVLAIRDLAVSVERSADLLVQDSKTSLDFLIAKSATEQAAAASNATEEARKLNQLAAFFFPLVTLTAVFSMNRPSEIMNFGEVWIVVLAGLGMGAVVWKILRR